MHGSYTQETLNLVWWQMQNRGCERVTVTVQELTAAVQSLVVGVRYILFGPETEMPVFGIPGPEGILKGVPRGHSAGRA